MRRIVLSLVVYKARREELMSVLRSCAESSDLLSDICIVDNSPTDDLRAFVKGYGFTYIHRPDNPGFGASHNHAFSTLGFDSEYYFVVNPDIEFSVEALRLMLDYADKNSEVGLVVPRAVYPDGTPQYNRSLLPTPSNMILRRFFSGSTFGQKQSSEFELRFMRDQAVVEVPAFTGCFMLIRSRLFREIGGFDERFFMYFEDYDISRRIGMVAKTIYFPLATIVHEHARGSHKSIPLFLAMVESAVRYFNKWGWFFDRKRSALNRKTINCLRANLLR